MPFGHFVGKELKLLKMHRKFQSFIPKPNDTRQVIQFNFVQHKCDKSNKHTFNFFLYFPLLKF